MNARPNRLTPPTASRLTLSIQTTSLLWVLLRTDYIALPWVRLHLDRNFFRALPCNPWAFACSGQALEIASLSALLILVTDEADPLAPVQRPFPNPSQEE